MNTTKRRVSLVILAGAFYAAGCGSDSGEHAGRAATTVVDPIVGTWTWTGRAPGPTTLTITFNTDKTFVFDEQVSPASEPAGSMPDGCVTTELYHGTYSETDSQDANRLTWVFTDGTANEVTGCNDPSVDSAGTPMTPDAVASRIEQGQLPPTTVTFRATASTLLLASPSGAIAGVGRSLGTTFTKVP